MQLINHFGVGLEHTIVSAQSEAMQAASLIDDNIPAHYPDDFPPLAGPASAARLDRLAQAMRGFDLILSYNWGAMDGVMAHRLLARKYGLAPLIHHEDGFNEDEQLKLKPQRNLYRRLALAGAAALVVPSRTLEDISRRVWKQPLDRIHYIPNGIDTAQFGEAVAPNAIAGLKKSASARWLGTLAGLRKVKNLPLLVEAFARLPLHWELVIVGDGPEREAIIHKAKELGVNDRLHLPGFVPYPPEYVGLFDIFALSSSSEQFPISVLEAMAAGLPVASTDVGDVRQMVSPQNQQYICSSAEFISSLSQLARNQDARISVGKANQIKARAEYDQQAMFDSYQALYSRVSQGGE